LFNIKNLKAMTLVKTNPKGALIPSVFSDFFDSNQFFSPRWFEREFSETLPAVNIKEDGKQFNIELAVPGFSKGDFKITAEDDVLTLSAEKKEEKSEKDERYTRREYSYSSFSRSFSLPQNANAEKVDAKYENGILKLALPKKEETKASPRKEIKVS
jgi:HSP20 family protein